MTTNWIKERENLQKLIQEDKLSYEEIGRQYGCTGTNIKKVSKRLGIELESRRAINPKETFNRGKRMTATCIHCGTSFTPYSSSKNLFCCHECSTEYRKKKLVEDWKAGLIDGTAHKTFSYRDFVKRYLMEKHNCKCEKCGWGETNPYTGNIPLQVHHIDGNSCNNAESNLQLLCPNCHNLTENYGSRNKNAPEGKHEFRYGNRKSKTKDIAPSNNEENNSDSE